MIQNILHRHRQPPDDLWVQCPGCHELIYRREYRNKLQTCPKCNYHGRLIAKDRIESLVDPGTWAEEAAGLRPSDPLGFVSLGQRYPDKVAETQEKTGLDEAVVTGIAQIEGLAARLAVCDFAFLGASMGSVVGEKIARAVERSCADRRPLVLVCASGGARMHEGIYSLMQMAKTSAAIARLGQAQVPCISILTDPTTGGVTASFASLGDVILAEPSALIGFAGPRVIEQTTKQKLPPDAQRPEFLLKHGMLDAITHRRELRLTVAKLLRLYAGARPPESNLQPPTPAPARDLQPQLPAEDAWRIVQLARHAQRPFTLDYVGMLCSEFFELHGDRQYADDSAIVAGIGTFDGRTIAIVGHQKGRTTQERLNRRFGMARPEGYRKAMRVMRHAQKFGFPVITFIDTPGADPSLEAEQRGQAWAIAESLTEMAQLTVPSVAVVIGEGGSGGALAIGVADRVLMLENATYSVVSPEGCASILWNDAALAPQAAAAMQITAAHLAAAGVVDFVVPEPEGGAHEDYAQAGVAVREGVEGALADIEGRFMLSSTLDVAALVAARFEKYRRIGVVVEPPPSRDSSN
ncbi:MAG: acetyl-CoA carboxylase carboxyltransferase subunit alpha [Chloroflexi bacterium]|nr:acetyl-CoA carboxylase carboxyltransferase subunit alpha [Chloroflexota bacterium]